MATKSIKISIKTALDAAGIQATETQLDQMAEHIKGVNASVKRGMRDAANEDGFVKSFHKAKESALKFVGVFTAVIATFKAGWEIGNKAREIFLDIFSTSAREAKKAEKACADFNESMRELADRSVKRVADEYAKLSTSIAKVNAERQRQNQLIRDELRYAHEAEDAQSQLDKQKELAGLDPSDDAGRERINAKYAESDEQKAAMRKKEAAVIRSQELEQQASDARKAASLIDAKIVAAEKSASFLRTRAGTLGALSNERNEADGRWYNKSARTDDGDKIRAEQRKESQKAKSEADALESSIARMKADADRLRADANAADASRTALYKEIETAETMMKTASIKAANARAVSDAKAAENVADAEKKIADARKEAAKKAAKFRYDEERKYQKKISDEETAALRKRHETRKRQLDEDAAKTQEMIDRLLARGADNPMARAGGGGWQRDEIKGERQSKINDKRIEDEQKKLEKKARDKLGDFWEAALDDPEELKKLGRLSNIQKAALEKLKLDKEQKKLKDLEEKKQKAIENMDKTLDDIKKKLAAVGL